MTEGTEHALEYVVAAGMFCMAIAMLIWLHGAMIQQITMLGKEPECVILFEREGGLGWNHSDE